MTAKKMLEENRNNQDKEKKRLSAEKSKVEKAMCEAEDSRFVNHTLSEEAFQRIYSRYEIQLTEIDKQLSELGQDHSHKIIALEKILRLAENIGKAYKEADFYLKRNYLGLFFKDFRVRKGKIVKFNLSDVLKPLIENGSVRVINTGLPRVDSNH